MLTRLRIQNFKAWRDTGDIRLAPITVFFGTNSSGKSSLLQFLLMLRQTAESPDRRRVLHPGDRNSLVQLGTFKDLVFNHEPTQNIEFSLEWTLPKPMVVENPLSSDRVTGKIVAFSARLASDPEGAQQHVQLFQYELQNEKPVVTRLEASGNGATRKYELTTENYQLVRRERRTKPLRSPARFYGFPEDIGACFQNAGFTSDLELALEQQLKRILYLGPLRIHPERSYVWTGEVPEQVGSSGERAVAAMLAASGRLISAGRKKAARPFQTAVSYWLAKMGLVDYFKVRASAPRRKEYQVLVRTRWPNLKVNLADVGFGVAQVFPVVVQCFYSAPYATVLLEQPEIHLHPRVQTELADLFVEAIRSLEGGSDRSVQLIIESHSEHFLRRLQRRIAEQVVTPEEVALYFCEMGTQGARLRPLEVNQHGDIVNWPDDFFGDEMGELAARMDAAAKRESATR